MGKESSGQVKKSENISSLIDSVGYSKPDTGGYSTIGKPITNPLDIKETPDQYEQRLHNEQSGTERIGIGAGKFVLNTFGSATGALNALVGLGNVAAVAKSNLAGETNESLMGAFIDNPVNQTLAELTKAYDEKYQVHSNPQDNSILDSVFSTAFISDLIGSAGFTVGGNLGNAGIQYGSKKFRNYFLKSITNSASTEANVLANTTKKLSDIVKGSNGVSSLMGAATGRAYESMIEAQQSYGDAFSKAAEQYKEIHPDATDNEIKGYAGSVADNARLQSFTLNMALGYSDMKQAGRLFNTTAKSFQRVGNWYTEALKQFVQEGAEEYAQTAISKYSKTIKIDDNMLDAFAGSLFAGVQQFGDKESSLAFLSGGLTGGPAGAYIGLKNKNAQDTHDSYNKKQWEVVADALKDPGLISTFKSNALSESYEEKKNIALGTYSTLNNLDQISPEIQSLKIPGSDRFGTGKGMTYSDLITLKKENPEKFNDVNETLKQNSRFDANLLEGMQLANYVSTAIETDNLDSLKMELQTMASSEDEEMSGLLGVTVDKNLDKKERLSELNQKISKLSKMYDQVSTIMGGASSERKKQAVTSLYIADEFSRLKNTNELLTDNYNILPEITEAGNSLFNHVADYESKIDSAKKKNTYKSKDAVKKLQQLVEDSNESRDIIFTKTDKDGKSTNSKTKFDKASNSFIDPLASDAEDVLDFTGFKSDIGDLSDKEYMAQVKEKLDPIIGNDSVRMAKALSEYKSNKKMIDLVNNVLSEAQKNYSDTLDSLEWAKNNKPEERTIPVSVKIDQQEEKTEDVKASIFSHPMVSGLDEKYKTNQMTSIVDSILNRMSLETPISGFESNLSNDSEALSAINELMEILNDPTQDNRFPLLAITRICVLRDAKDGNVDFLNDISNHYPHISKEQIIDLIEDVDAKFQRIKKFQPEEDGSYNQNSLFPYVAQFRDIAILKNVNTFLNKKQDELSSGKYTAQQIKRQIENSLRRRYKSTLVKEDGKCLVNGDWIDSVNDGMLNIPSNNMISHQMYTEIVSKYEGVLNSLTEDPTGIIGYKEALRSIETFDAFANTQKMSGEDSDFYKKGIELFKSKLLSGEEMNEFKFRINPGTEIPKTVTKKFNLDDYSNAEVEFFANTSNPTVKLVYLKDGKEYQLSFNETQLRTVSGNIVSSPLIDSMISRNRNKISDLGLGGLIDISELSNGQYNVKYNYTGRSKRFSGKDANVGTLADLPDNIFYGPKRILAKIISTNKGANIMGNPFVRLKNSKNTYVEIAVTGSVLSDSDINTLSAAIENPDSVEKSKLISLIERTSITGIDFSDPMSLEKDSNGYYNRFSHYVFEEIYPKLNSIVNKTSKKEFVLGLSDNPDFTDININDEEFSDINSFAAANNLSDNDYIYAIASIIGVDKANQIEELYSNYANSVINQLVENGELTGIHLGLNFSEKKGAYVIAIPYKTGTGEEIEYINDSNGKRISIDFFLNKKFKSESGRLSMNQYAINDDTLFNSMVRAKIVKNSLFPNVKKSAGDGRNLISDRNFGAVESPIDIVNNGKIRLVASAKIQQNNSTVTTEQESIPVVTESVEDFIPVHEVVINNNEDDELIAFKVITSDQENYGNLSRAKRWISRNLPSDISIKDMDDLVKNIYNSGQTMGAFTGNTIYLKNGAYGSVAYHESFHAVFNGILSKADKNYYLDIAKEDISGITKEEVSEFRLQSGLYSKMSDSQLIDRIAEEHLADEFAKYMVAKDDASAKLATEPWYVQLWEKLKSIINWFTENQNEIERLFDSIDKGLYKNSKVIISDSGNQFYKTIRNTDGQILNDNELNNIARGFISHLTQANINDKSFNINKVVSKSTRPVNGVSPYDNLKSELISFIDVQKNVLSDLEKNLKSSQEEEANTAADSPDLKKIKNKRISVQSVLAYLKSNNSYLYKFDTSKKDGNFIDEVVDYILSKKREIVEGINVTNEFELEDDDSYASISLGTEQSNGEYSETIDDKIVKKIIDSTPAVNQPLQEKLMSLIPIREGSEHILESISNGGYFAKYNRSAVSYSKLMTYFSGIDDDADFKQKLIDVSNSPDFRSISRLSLKDGRLTPIGYLFRKVSKIHYIETFINGRDSEKNQEYKTKNKDTLSYRNLIISRVEDSLSKLQASDLNYNNPEFNSLINNILLINNKIIGIAPSDQNVKDLSFSVNGKSVTNRYVLKDQIKDSNYLSSLLGKYGIIVGNDFVDYLNSNNRSFDREKKEITANILSYLIGLNKAYDSTLVSKGLNAGLAKDAELFNNSASGGSIFPSVNHQSVLKLYRSIDKYTNTVPLLTMTKFGEKMRWNFSKQNLIIENVNKLNTALDLSEVANDGITAYLPYLQDIENGFLIDENGIEGGQMKRVRMGIYAGYEDSFGGSHEFKKIDVKRKFHIEEIDAFFSNDYPKGVRRFMPHVLERKNTQYMYEVKTPYKKSNTHSLFTSKTDPKSRSVVFDFNNAADFKNGLVGRLFDMFVSNVSQINGLPENNKSYKKKLQKEISYLEPFIKDFTSNPEKTSERIKSEINSRLVELFNSYFIDLQERGIVNVNITGPSTGRNGYYNPSDITKINKAVIVRGDFSGEDPSNGINRLIEFWSESFLFNTSIDHAVRGDNRRWKDENQKAKRGAGMNASTDKMTILDQDIYSDGVPAIANKDQQEKFKSLVLGDMIKFIKNTPLGTETFSVNGKVLFHQSEINTEVKSLVYDGGFRAITITDGQAYTTAGRALNWMISQGKIRNDFEKSIMTKLVLDEDFSDSELKYFDNNHHLKLSPFKDVYFDNSIYGKESTFPLLRQMISNKVVDPALIEKLNTAFLKDNSRRIKVKGIEYFKDSENGKWYTEKPIFNGVVSNQYMHFVLNEMQEKAATHAQHDSTLKLSYQDLLSQDGTLDLKNRYHGIQQETPSSHDKVIDGTQLQSLILTAINPNTSETFEGMSFGEFRDQITAIQTLIRTRALDSLISKYTTGSEDIENRDLDIDKLYSRLNKMNIQTGKSLLASMFDRIDGEFVPKDLSKISTKLVEALNSLINAEVLRQKVHGDKYYAVSSMGFDVFDFKTNSSRPLKIHGPRYNKNGSFAGADYSEVIISASTAEQYSLKIGDNIPENLLVGLGIRIPTESAHSMIPMKIVSLMPNYIGSVIVVPDEFVDYSGMDYDIDSIFANFPEFEKVIDANGKVASYRKLGYDLSDPREMHSSYIEYVKEVFDVTIKSIDDISPIERADPGRISFMRAKGYPVTFEEYLQQPVLPSSRLKNQQLDLRLLSFNNEEQLKAARTKANTEGMNDGGKEIADLFGISDAGMISNTPQQKLKLLESQRAGVTLVDVAIAQNTGYTMALSYGVRIGQDKNSLDVNEIVDVDNPEFEYIADPNVNNKIYDLEKDENNSYKLVLTDELRLDSGTSTAASILDDAKDQNSYKYNYSADSLSASFGFMMIGISKKISGFINNNPIIVSYQYFNNTNSIDKFESILDDIKFKLFYDQFYSPDASLNEKKYKNDYILFKTKAKNESGDTENYDAIQMLYNQYAKDLKYNVHDSYTVTNHVKGRVPLTLFGSQLYSTKTSNVVDDINNQYENLLVSKNDFSGDPLDQILRTQLNNYVMFSKALSIGSDINGLYKGFTSPLKGFSQGQDIDFNRLKSRIRNYFIIKDSVINNQDSLINKMNDIKSEFDTVISRGLVQRSPIFNSVYDILVKKSTPNLSKSVSRSIFNNEFMSFMIKSYAASNGMIDGKYDFIVNGNGEQTAIFKKYFDKLKSVSDNTNLYNKLSDEDVLGIANNVLGEDTIIPTEARGFIDSVLPELTENKFFYHLKFNKKTSPFEIDSERTIGNVNDEIVADFDYMPSYLKGAIMSQAIQSGLVETEHNKISRWISSTELASPSIRQMMNTISDLTYKTTDEASINQMSDDLESISDTFQNNLIKNTASSGSSDTLIKSFIKSFIRNHKDDGMVFTDADLKIIVSSTDIPNTIEPVDILSDSSSETGEKSRMQKHVFLKKDKSNVDGGDDVICFGNKYGYYEVGSISSNPGMAQNSRLFKNSEYFDHSRSLASFDEVPVFVIGSGIKSIAGDFAYTNINKIKNRFDFNAEQGFYSSEAKNISLIQDFYVDAENLNEIDPNKINMKNVKVKVNPKYSNNYLDKPKNNKEFQKQMEQYFKDTVSIVSKNVSNFILEASLDNRDLSEYLSQFKIQTTFDDGMPYEFKKQYDIIKSSLFEYESYIIGLSSELLDGTFENHNPVDLSSWFRQLSLKFKRSAKKKITTSDVANTISGLINRQTDLNIDSDSTLDELKKIYKNPLLSVTDILSGVVDFESGEIISSDELNSEKVNRFIESIVRQFNCE